ncbi:hypothetical protein [Priestia megaterium]|uniref:hypothetical protein n=1 Tax=Priestia megaterium TaxID=1404 RepID=UPI00101BDFD7|nr:hypothetical protein [Priestia megaterium]
MDHKINNNKILDDPTEWKLYNFLDEISHVEEATEILETIFDTHFQHDDSSQILRNLTNHISGTFKTSKTRDFLNYLARPNILIEDSSPEMKRINRLKYKYGFMIYQMLEKDRKPFLINSVDVNIDKDSTHHRIRFVRSDGKDLEALFTTTSIMPIISLLNRAATQSIEKGVFSIQEDMMDKLLDSSLALVETLNNIKRKNEEENNNLN